MCIYKNYRDQPSVIENAVVAIIILSDYLRCRSFKSNRFTRKWVNIDFFSNWWFNVTAERNIYIYIFTLIHIIPLARKDDRIKKKKTKSFHRDCVLRSLNTYYYTVCDQNAILSSTLFHSHSLSLCFSPANSVFGSALIISRHSSRYYNTYITPTHITPRCDVCGESWWPGIEGRMKHRG